eukprot:symbB.v1.2.023205.t1/scaffold2101.1/size89465/6
MIDRLLVYAPAISADPTQQESLKELRQGLIEWAEPADGSVHTALLRFFQAYDKDCDGVLSIPETVHGLRQVQSRRISSAAGELYQRLFGRTRPSWSSLGSLDFGPDGLDYLDDLVELLDTNSTGTLSFLELARGLGERTMEVQALLRACRSLDIEGSGQLPAQEFLMLLNTVTPTEGLQEAVKQPVAYAELLSSFEVKLDLDAVMKCAGQKWREWRYGFQKFYLKWCHTLVKLFSEVMSICHFLRKTSLKNS